MMRTLLFVIAISAFGCGGGAASSGAHGAEAPTSNVPQPPPPSGNAFALPSSLRDDTRLLREPPVPPLAATPLPPSPTGVAAPPSTCASFAQRKAARQLSCSDATAALAALDKAMSESDASRRDALLLDLEACQAIPAGLVRALRADLAPEGCADVLVEPLLASAPQKLLPIVHHALFGQALGARLARTATNPPKLAPPYERRRVLDFIHGPVRDWLVEQAKAIQDISQLGSGLASYGRGVAALEAGLADLRLVEAVRAMPIADEIARDPEAKNVYYAELDQLLDPRKQRGRDAALVGLRDFSMLGALHDARVARTRKLLSELYGGRRVDALDALLVPPLPPAPAGSVEERLAARLPTFYASFVVDPRAATRPGVLRALLEQGIPLPHRTALHGVDLPPDAKVLYARGRFELGRTYWHAVDFDRTVALASSVATDEAKLLLSLGLALHDTPEDVADLMRRASREPLGVVQTNGLDFLARSKPRTAYAGMAAFDAAVVREIGAPRPGDPAYWKDVAARFREAASLLQNPGERSKAEESAHAADATATAIKP